MTQPARSHYSNEQLAADVGALSQRVIGHEATLSEFKTITQSGIQSLQADIRTLAHSMQQSGKPQWGAWSAMAGVVLTAFTFFVIQPLKDDMRNLAQSHVTTPLLDAKLESQEWKLRFLTTKDAPWTTSTRIDK